MVRQAHHVRSLRAILTVSMVSLAGLSVLGALALAALDARLHLASMRLGLAIERVALAEQLEMDLLAAHQVSGSVRLRLGPGPGVSRAEVAARVRRDLIVLAESAKGVAEAESIERLRAGVERYLQARAAVEEDGVSLPRAMARTDGALTVALADVRALQRASLLAAKEARAQGTRWDFAAHVGGVAAGVALVAGIGGVLLWTRRSAVAPLLRIGGAIERFGAGDRDARAPEEGPDEIRAMARTFNETAATVARHHERQLLFLASVAHDLRNPLAALRVATERFAPGRPSPAPERMVTTLALVHRIVHRLDRLVGDLLESARVEAGQLELRFEQRDVPALVSDVVALYRSSATLHQLALVLPDGPIELRCDPLRIEQVLSNLVSNAIKYSPAGGLIAVTVEHRPDECVISVRDEGVGISAEDLPYIFDPFRRSATARARFPGIGLGLSVARKIVLAHGGRIVVESAPGRGSVFRVHLPFEHRGGALDANDDGSVERGDVPRAGAGRPGPPPAPLHEPGR